MSVFRAKLPFLATTAIALLCSAPALARGAEDTLAQDEVSQDEAQAEEEQSANSATKDIIVTARRREESVQTTPVTITAYSGEQLETKGIVEPVNLVRVTPGLSFDQYPPGNLRPRIRAVSGGGVNLIDGIWASTNHMLNIDFYDMERIEVLKGPQGTLYGKNAISGVINFITAKPVERFEASARLTLGQYGQKNASFMLNNELTKGVSARVVVSAITNTGFRHTANGDPLDDINKKSARAHFLWNIADGTSLLLSGDYSFTDNSDETRFNIFALPFVAGEGRGDIDKPRVANPDHPGYTHLKTGGLHAEFSSDAPGFANWTLLAGWRTSDYDVNSDLDGSTVAANIAAGIPRIRQQTLQLTQADAYSLETRLTSTHGGPLSWVVGAYFGNAKSYGEIETIRTLATDTFDKIQRNVQDQSSNSYAAFGEAEFKLFRGFSVFAGARYTKEDSTSTQYLLTGNRANPTVAFSTVANPPVYDGDQITYRLGGNWQVTDHIFLFGSVSTGYKSPGFPGESSTLVAALQVGPEEKGTNYEVGIKSDWLDRHVRINASLFRMNYYDFGTGKTIPDLSACSTCTRQVNDPASALIKGVETEFVVVPFDWLDATIRYTYLDAIITKLIQTSSINANGTPNFTDGAGNRLSRTPEHGLTADVGVQTDRYATWGWVRAEVSMDYQSDIFDNNVNDYYEYRKGRTLWDASITYHVNEDYSVQAWVHNITDVEYRTFQTYSAPNRYHYVVYGPPRQFGVTFNAKFR